MGRNVKRTLTGLINIPSILDNYQGANENLMKIVDEVTRAYLQLIARQTNKHDVNEGQHKPDVGTIVSFTLEDKKFHRNQSRLRYGLVTGKYDPGQDGIS